jgi:hypothetical protein
MPGKMLSRVRHRLEKLQHIAVTSPTAYIRGEQQVPPTTAKAGTRFVDLLNSNCGVVIVITLLRRAYYTRREA